MLAAPLCTKISSSSILGLCEALGFSPQLLLDDIINISNNVVQVGVNRMEEFLLQKGRQTPLPHLLLPAPVLVPLTSLEYHTGIAFSFFEAWCLRNVFIISLDFIDIREGWRV